MNQKLCLAGLLCLSPMLASAADVYVSGGYSSLSHDESRLVVQQTITPAGSSTSQTTETEYFSSGDDSDALHLSWGLVEDSARFAIEYLYQTSDFGGFDLDYTKHSLYYSGYWTPDLGLKRLGEQWPRIHGILGGGIGVSELTLESGEEAIGSSFKDRGLQIKAAIGLEYRITPHFAVFGVYEYHINETYRDWPSSKHGLEFDDGDQKGFTLGISGRIR